jgi:hypothetical protein
MTTASKKTLYDGARDWMNKADRKIADLAATPIDDEARQRDNATDCMTTIWHALDYIWHDTDEPLRTRIGLKADAPMQKLADLQSYLTRRCEALRLCQQSANGTKHNGYHGRYVQFEDPDVSALVSGSDTTALVPVRRFISKIVNAKTGERLPMLDVARDARDFLVAFMDEWNIGK